MDKRILLDVLRDAFLDKLGSMDALPEGVWKRTGALNTWGTNALEGNTLTQAEVEQLLIEASSVEGRPVPDVIETLQHEEAFRGLLARRAKPIDLVVVQELHQEVFRGIPGMRPGQWRLSNPYIGGTKYRPPRREKVVPRLDAWLAAYRRREKARKKVFDVAAWFHHEFEAIHPFENGNGRAGRLLLNLHFLKHDWPPLHVLPGDRKTYLAALEAGHAKDYRPLERFFAAAMTRSLLDLLDQVGDAKDELQPLAAFRNKAWNPYAPHYLALRARQGALAALHVTNSSAPATVKRRAGRPAYLTSERALRHYVKAKGRTDAVARAKDLPSS